MRKIISRALLLSVCFALPLRAAGAAASTHVLFDPNALMYSKDAWAKAACTVGAKYGLQLPANVTDLCSLPLGLALQKVSNNEVEFKKNINQIFYELNASVIASQPPAVEGIEALLAQLQKDNIECKLFGTDKARIATIIDNLKLNPYITDILQTNSNTITLEMFDEYFSTIKGQAEFLFDYAQKNGATIIVTQQVDLARALEKLNKESNYTVTLKIIGVPWSWYNQEAFTYAPNTEIVNNIEELERLLIDEIQKKYL